MGVLDESVPGAAHALERLGSDELVWITSVRADGQPQSSCVWFHWSGSDFLVLSQPTAPKLRNVAGNPLVSLHLDSDGRAGDLVIVEGEAEVLAEWKVQQWPGSDRIAAYYAKYERTLREVLRSTAEEMGSAFSSA